MVYEVIWRHGQRTLGSLIHIFKSYKKNFSKNET